VSELEHDPAGDVWARHADGKKRDRERDKLTRAAMLREKRGEYDADGNFRPSTWSDAMPDDEGGETRFP
jgi:hypothetical protein